MSNNNYNSQNTPILEPEIAYASSSTPTTPAPAPAVATPATPSSSSNDSYAVKLMQENLNKKNSGQAGYVPLVVDGIYGPKTKAATQFVPSSTGATSTASSGGVDPNTPVGTIYNTGDPQNSGVDDAENDLENYYKNLGGGSDADIRNNILSQYQGEIDASNAIFAEKLRQAKLTGADRVGSGTAIEARRGLLGSDFGAAQTDKINTDNNAIYAGIDQEKQAALSTILNQSRTEADQAIKDKNDATEKGLDARLKYLQDADTRKDAQTTKAAQFLLAQKYDPADIPKDVLDTIAKNYGTTSNTLKAEYAIQKKAQDDADAKAAQDAEFSLSEGQARYDKDGKLLAARAKTYAPTAGSGSDGLYVPGANPSVDAWVSQINDSIQSGAKFGDLISKVPAAIKGLVTQGVNANSGKPVVTPVGKMVAKSAQELLDKLNSEKFAPVGGDSAGSFAALPGTATRDFIIDFNTLKSQLSLDGAQYLKGQGQISDGERQLLADATSKLNRAQSKDEFKKTLQAIIDRLSATDTSSDADTTTPSDSTGTDDDLLSQYGL